jgi:hypothetical protein
MDPKVTALLTEQLSERAAHDPFAALMLSQLSQQHESTEPDPVPDQALERAIRTINKLRADLAAANKMATQVAQVIGACPACWGLDLLCRQCHGSGTPGSRMPDVDALFDWLGPAISRAGLVTATPQFTHDPSHHPRRSDDVGT